MSVDLVVVAPLLVDEVVTPGRRDIEDVLKTVQVSGKTVAVQTTQGGLQLYYCPRYGNPTEGTISQFDKYKTLFYCMTSFW